MSAKFTALALNATCVSALLLAVGCASNDRASTRNDDDHWQVDRVESADTSRTTSGDQQASSTQQVDRGLGEWPDNAVPGECYAKAYVPPRIETVQEQVAVREASERIEIVPAQYEWIEERVMVKDATTNFVEVPAEFETRQVTMEVRPSQTGWFMNADGSCTTVNGQPAASVFCYVTRPSETRTVSQQKVARAASFERIEVPAEYTTVRRQRLVSAPTTRKIEIPAEYETVERTLVAAPARWEWQRVVCDTGPLTMNAVKRALVAAGYEASPVNGEMTAQDWASVKAYQLANGLGVGNLSHETLEHMQVSSIK